MDLSEKITQFEIATELLKYAQGTPFANDPKVMQNMTKAVNEAVASFTKAAQGGATPQQLIQLMPGLSILQGFFSPMVPPQLKALATKAIQNINPFLIDPNVIAAAQRAVGPLAAYLITGYKSLDQKKPVVAPTVSSLEVLQKKYGVPGTGMYAGPQAPTAPWKAPGADSDSWGKVRNPIDFTNTSPNGTRVPQAKPAKPQMMPDTKVKQVQRVLNRHYGFRGEDSKPLIEDGILGKNTRYAMETYKNMFMKDALDSTTQFIIHHILQSAIAHQ